MNILIADDSPVSRLLLLKCLQKWGYEVTVAENGAAAWRIFQEGLFPMVITDWLMPKLDGPDLIRLIRSAHRAGYTYTMLVTSLSQKEALVEGMESGADDFLTKPFDREELRVRIRAGERIIRLEQNLRATQAALLQTEQLASLGRLAAGVAHEINNPLSFVVNNLTVLQRDVGAALALLDKYGEGHATLCREQPELAAEVTELKEEMDLEYVRDNLGRLFHSSSEGLERIRAIVQNLRTFARLDESEHKEVDLNVALESTLEALHHEFREKQLQVRTDFQALPLVACHPGKINQVFLNILTNAIQVSEPEGLIEVVTRPDSSGGAVAEIRDHGSGIRPEHVPHIFEPFFTTKPVGGGAGLGLSVSYGIVRDHGGSLEVETSVGQGSLFRIRLPSRTPLTNRPPSPTPPDWESNPVPPVATDPGRSGRDGPDKP